MTANAWPAIEALRTTRIRVEHWQACVVTATRAEAFLKQPWIAGVAIAKAFMDFFGFSHTSAAALAITAHDAGFVINHRVKSFSSIEPIFS
ncbi:hypothetical protein D9M71_758100 [compost metagenome]